MFNFVYLEVQTHYLFYDVVRLLLDSLEINCNNVRRVIMLTAIPL